MKCKIPLSLLDRYYSVLTDPKTKVRSVKVKFAIAKLTQAIENELEILRKTAEPDDEFKEFETKRLKILSKYAERDEQGNILYEDEAKTTVKVKNKEELNKEVQELIKQYEEAIQNRNKQLEEIRELVNSKEIEVDLPEIKIHDLDPDIPQSLMNLFVKLDIIR